MPNLRVYGIQSMPTAIIIAESRVENYQFMEGKMAQHDNDSTPIHISTDRQLFVDDFWIDEAQDVTRRLHEPVRRETVISAEHPWETGRCFLHGNVP